MYVPIGRQKFVIIPKHTMQWNLSKNKIKVFYKKRKNLKRKALNKILIKQDFQFPHFFLPFIFISLDFPFCQKFFVG